VERAERPPLAARGVRLVRLRERALEERDDDRVEARVDRLDAADVRLDGLARRQLAGRNRPRDFRGAQTDRARRLGAFDGHNIRPAFKGEEAGETFISVECESARARRRKVARRTRKREA
jgi:hypothetical protein